MTATTVEVKDMEPFENDKGEVIKYKRLCISGYIGGSLETLEIKLEKSEMLLAKMLLTSTEDAPTVTAGKATAEERAAFLKGVSERSTQIGKPNSEQRTGTILDDNDEIAGKLFD